MILNEYSYLAWGVWPTWFCGQQRVLWPTRGRCGQHSLPKLWEMVPAPWHDDNSMATELGECVSLVVWPSLRRMLIETSGIGKPQQVLCQSVAGPSTPVQSSTCHRCGQTLALEHLTGGKALAHDQTPSFST